MAIFCCVSAHVFAPFFHQPPSHNTYMTLSYLLTPAIGREKIEWSIFQRSTYAMARPLFICLLLLTAAPSLVAHMQGAPSLAAGAELTADDMRNAAALVGNLPAAFQLFKTVFGSEYNAEGEEETRFRNFAANIANAVAAFARNPTATYGATPFSDMSEAEFADSVLSKQTSNSSAPQETETPFAELPPAYVHRRAPLTNGMDARTARRDAFKALADDLPAKFDWRPHNILQKVKYQGACGSCWAFVVVGSIESQWALAGHGLPNLSEQQLISCDYTNSACNGGKMENAFRWILQQNKGYVASASYYPQTSFAKERPAACNNVGAGAAAKITNFITVPRSEDQLAQYTVNVGPVVIYIEASNWQHYTGGIISNCRNYAITHAVLVVGYDKEHDPPYWIVKNSWSSQWGEGGYARVRMGTNECLLVSNNPTIAVVPDSTFDKESLPTGDPARFVELEEGPDEEHINAPNQSTTELNFPDDDAQGSGAGPKAAAGVSAAASVVALGYALLSGILF